MIGGFWLWALTPLIISAVLIADMLIRAPLEPDDDTGAPEGSWWSPHYDPDAE